MLSFRSAFIALFCFVLFNPFSNAQIDTTKEKHTQYRRGIALQSGYQSYEQKYEGKNLLEEKKRLYPLGFGTNHFGKTAAGSGVWTELSPLVPRVDYFGIHFINPDTGWACGDLGTVIKTTDGGGSWTTEQTNTTTLILKVKSYNGNIVVASGYSGLLLRSGDGGETWTQVTSGVTGDLWGLQMVNDTLGWAGGYQSSLTKTTDGGLTWNRVYTPGYTGNYWWIDFMNENYGFIAGDGKVLKTTDGGGSWDVIQAGDGQPLYSIDVIDSLHIAAAGYNNKMVYSEDSGETWSQHQVLGDYPEVECIKFINPDTGYVVGAEQLTKTTDRGNSWIPLIIINIGDYELQFLSGANIGYSAGESLKLYKSVDNLDVWNKMIINEGLYDVFFTSAQKGFVISEIEYGGGNLYRTTNAGIDWDAVQGVPGGYCLTFTDSLTGFYGSTTGAAVGRIYKTTDGGEDWDSTNINVITGPVVKIFFINSTTGWAVTSYNPLEPEGNILKTTDGGSDWFEQFSALSGPAFNSIYFVDSLYGWVSCVNARPYKTTDGGENWIEQTNLDFYNTKDVYFTSRDTGWITDGTLGFYKTTDGGISWEMVNGLSPAKFSFLPDKNHWWAYDPNLYETTDNGSSWNEITRPSPMFGNFYAPLNWMGYGVGGGGYIVKYVDSSFTPVEFTSLNAELNNNNITLNWTTATETNNQGFEVERQVVSRQSSVVSWQLGKDWICSR